MNLTINHNHHHKTISDLENNTMFTTKDGGLYIKMNCQAEYYNALCLVSANVTNPVKAGDETYFRTQTVFPAKNMTIHID